MGNKRVMLEIYNCNKFNSGNIMSIYRKATLATLIATISASSFAITGEELQNKISDLSLLIDTVAAKNIDVERERMTLHTSQLFLTWADWDSEPEHIAIISKYYESLPSTKDDPSAYAASLAQVERDSVEQILDDAISELSKVNTGEIVRRPAIVTDYKRVTLEDGHLLQDGKPVFIGAYTWKPDETLSNQYFGNLHSNYISPTLFSNDQWAYSDWKFNDYTDAENDLRIGQTFIAQTFPTWAKTLYPEIGEGARIFHSQDIDHPFTKTLYSKLFEAVIPKLIGKRSTELGYMIFNEPSFITKKDSWNNGLEKLSGQKDDPNSSTVSVTEHTFSKFRSWLSAQHSSIEALNTLWGSSFTNFADVTITIPIDDALRGTPIWYDWCLFNMSRGTEWFQFLNDGIKDIDSDAKTHIKLMPWLWNGNQRDHGMDFESLLMMGDIIGFDANAQYSHIYGKTMDWESEYAFDWQSAMMSFDFFTSVQPKQLLWDSENHFFTSSKFMERDNDPDYVRSIYWMAFTHGLSGSSTWVWSRQENGDFSDKLNGWGADKGDAGSYDKEYIVDVTHQPKGLHALTRTLLEANAHGEDLIKLQQQEKPLRLFYSETSAINQDDHMTFVRDAYKALYFEGMGLGFATQKIINNQTGKWEQLVINGAKYVTDAELAALQSYLDAGGSILIDSDSLKFNEYGEVRADALTSSNGQIQGYSSIAELQSKVRKEATEKHYLAEISVTELGDQTHKTIAWRIVKKEDGSHIISLVNTGKESITIKLADRDSDQPIVVKDMFTNQSISNTLTLDSREMQFISVNLVVSDEDSDGIEDSADNCPAISNSSQLNSDNDGQGDACDKDDDNDGVVDEQDAFPINPDEAIDSDGDNVGDNSDNCPTITNATQIDTDNDGQGDACELEAPSDPISKGSSGGGLAYFSLLLLAMLSSVRKLKR